MLASIRFDHIAINSNLIATLYSGEPVGDGRTYKVLVVQVNGSTGSLVERLMAGGFEPASVNGLDALYQESCWESPELTGSTGCMQTLAWFEGDTEYEITTYFPVVVPRDTLIAIAESMR
ncbi:MAG: hypothetical protein EHM70_24115 [Chloroflexota bacterium]|nr:MAG: hypothetical protein EHM70_24115 [Chloroflexota bacterium]